MSRLESKQRWGLGIGGILLTLLLAVVFTFGSLDVPFHPKSWREVMVLYAVSSFVTAALLVFLLILGRTTLRLWVERRREQLGARFKTKMVVGAMALSLLPIVFMFIVSYSLINRRDRKSTRLNSSHGYISYAVFCLKKKKKFYDSSRLWHYIPWNMVQ